ncbi:GRF zinc finger containing protein, partial [Striga asiatica]
MSASLSSNSRRFKLECCCGDEPGIFTSNTNLNPCRRFRRCINPEKPCRYFSWIDPELGPFQKSCFLKLKADKTLLEEQLKCKEVTVVAMAERLSLKNDELLYLKSKANDLEEQLKCEENTAVAMTERLEMKEDGLLCLKSKVNDLE